MKKTKRIFFIFCVFLMIALVLIMPYSGKTAEADSRFGINAFVLNRYNWEEWNRPIASINDLGVSWTREEFVWKQIEPEKGKYDWSFYDRAFAELSKSDINILGIIDYSAPWATSDHNRENADKYMPNIDDWRNYVGSVVDRYGTRVKYWQIWNEPNVPVFFKPKPNVADYFSLLKSASEVIRSKDPQAKVVLAGLSGIDVGYMDQLKTMGANEYFDIIALHPYRFDFRSPPEGGGLMEDLENSEEISQIFSNKDIWFTEFGWPNDTSGTISEDIQAKYLFRTYLLSFMKPSVKKLFWYDLRNDGDNKNYGEDNFGLINRDYSNKKSYIAYQTLIKLFSHAVFQKGYSLGDNGIYDLSFRKDGINIRAIWKIDGKYNFSMDDVYIDSQIYNIYGEKINPTKNSNGTTNIQISDMPMIIVSSFKMENLNQNVFYGDNYDYEYINQSVGALLKNDEKRELFIKLKNTGNTTWKNYGDNRMLLGTSRINDRASTFFDGSWIGNNRAALLSEKEVKPGDFGTFVFKVKANGIPNGNYKEYFTPLIEGVTWMRDIGIYWDINVNDMGDNAKVFANNYDYEYVSQEGKSELGRGEKTKITVKLKNTGREDWTADKFKLGTARSLDRNSVFASSWKNRITLDQSIVKPGEIGSFTFEVKAPNTSGVYKEYFRPVVDGISWLKDIGIYWKINIK